MLFSSLNFIYVFLPALFLLYFIIRNSFYRKCVLIAFSLLFYAWGEPVFVLLMLFTVMVNYLMGRAIGRVRRPSKKKFYMALAVIVNLSLLGFFKYTGFLVETLNLLPMISLPVPKIALPLGISFYTFQAMSYTIDVYRGDCVPQRSFADMLLYVSFFPQLVAGPIVRYQDIEAQLDNRMVAIEDINEGIYRFSLGLGKKVLLANACGGVADSLLKADAVNLSVAGLWVGAVFFALQIYYDFSGYSDMAIGLGRMFGFRFLENFKYPYISRSATEFWRRWHISLGTFFREYVYIPLGGNRSHWLRNVFVVWFLTGLWHGASFNFIAWGLFYALLLVLEKRALLPLFKKMGKCLGTIISYLYMFVVTVVGWTVFYFEDGFLSRVKMLFGGGNLPLTDIFLTSTLRQNCLLLGAALLLAFPVYPAICGWLKKRCGDSDGAYAAGRIIKMVIIIVLIGASTAMLAGNSYNPFLYFRF